MTTTRQAVPLHELTFPAMGTEVHLLTVGAGGPSSLTDARDLIASLEARWSRFRPDSELSRLNAAAGRPTILPDDTFSLVEVAVEAWRLTGGCFDPTVLSALSAAGYDRSFDLVVPDGPDSRDDRSAPAVPGCAGILLQPDLRLVHLPPGVTLDLGGIAKGCAADRAVATLLGAGASGAMANVGGDVRAEGLAPDGRAWSVAVDDPYRPGRDVVMLDVAEGGVATSSRTRRRWIRGGRVVHHLIDPATGEPADRGIDAVVIVAGQTLWAEVLAKAALIAGPAGAAALVARFGATGLLFLEDGETRLLPGLEAYLR